MKGQGVLSLWEAMKEASLLLEQYLLLEGFYGACHEKHQALHKVLLGFGQESSWS